MIQQCSLPLTWKGLVTTGTVVPFKVELKSLKDVALLLSERKASIVAIDEWRLSIQTGDQRRTKSWSSPGPWPRGKG